MNVNPFLFLSGRCEEAAHFYATALGGDVGPIHRRGSCAVPGEDPEAVQYTDVLVGGKRLLQMSDCVPESTYSGFSVSLDVPTVEQAEACFNALADGGAITLPFAPSFFSPGFGMLVDKFGVTWMVHSAPQEGACG
ncbi:hypothetical protein D3C85_1297080 [compost metagenome]